MNWSEAWNRVCRNHGRPGSDGISIERFEGQLKEGVDELRRNLASLRYRPWPLLEIIVQETIREGGPSRSHNPNGVIKQKRRTLRIPTVRDRLAQSVILQVIEPWIDEQLESSSFGYRHGRGVADAVEEIQKWHLRGYDYLVDTDIDSFFDNVNHVQVIGKFRAAVELPLRVAVMKKLESKNNLPRRLGLVPAAQSLPESSAGKDDFERLSRQALRELVSWITLWVQAEVWDGKEIAWFQRGLPQGSVVSPLLANLFLDELDETLLGQGFKLVRYADDFVVLCKTPQQAQTALQITEQRLSQLHLRLNQVKTRLVRFEDSFRFLGVFFWKDMLMQPLERRNRERHVFSLPPPLPPELAKRYKGRLK